MRRRKVKVRRENLTDQNISLRVQLAFDGWHSTLLTTRPEEIEKRLSKFLPLRRLIADADAAISLVDLKYGEVFLAAIRDMANKDLQISFLFATSDLVDVDDSGILGANLVHLGLIPEILHILRNIAPRSEYESRLKPAAICALSSLCLHDMDQTTDLMDVREILLLDSILQVKSMMHLHSRVITFINNVYVSGKFQSALAHQVIPSLMTLLMYNVTNHIKCRKNRQNRGENSDSSSDTISVDDNQQLQMEDPPTPLHNPSYVTSNKRARVNNGSSVNASSSAATSGTTNTTRRTTLGQPSAPPLQSNSTKNSNARSQQQQQSRARPGSNNTNGGSSVAELNGSSLILSAGDLSSESTESFESDYDIDPLYDDLLYNEFIESASYLMGNLTTSEEICHLAEQYSIIDIMTLLFHNTDTTLEALTSVIKCLGNLAHIESNRPKLMESNVLPIGAKLIKLNIDDEMKAQITLLLANMAGFDGCTQTLVSGGVIEPIAELLDSENEDHQRFASLALANMATDITAIPLLMHTQSLKVFVDLCYSTQPYIRRQATRVLNSVASYPTGVYWTALEEAAAIPALHYVMNVDAQATERPSAHLLAKTALGYLQGNAVASLPLTYPIQEPLLSLYHPLWQENHIQEARQQKQIRDEIVPDIDQADIEKNRGNELFTEKNYLESIDCYTRAIRLDQNNYAAFSNRAAAYMQVNQWELAFWDSDKCVALSPDFVKGHFRMGKALVGLDQFGEAVTALSTALKLKKNNKEIRDALQIATLKKKESVSTSIPLQIQRMRASEVIMALETLQSFGEVHHLLHHLFNLFKRYYYPTLDQYSKLELMGWCDIVDLETRLHAWATTVNLAHLMEKMAIAKILFETDLVTPIVRAHYSNELPSEPPHVTSQPVNKKHTNAKQQHLQGQAHQNQVKNNTVIAKKPQGNFDDPSTWHQMSFALEEDDESSADFSCHHFSFFVATILTRLSVQGHPKFGLRALKRLIVLDSNKLVRDSLGSSLTVSLLQASGYGGWGLPPLPALHHLFIHYGGLRCVALDAYEDPLYCHYCADILDSVVIKDWAKQSLNIIQTVVGFFIVPSLKQDEKLKRKAISVFCKMYTLPEIRRSFADWSDQVAGDFAHLCRFVASESNALLLQSSLDAISSDAEFAHFNLNVPLLPSPFPIIQDTGTDSPESVAASFASGASMMFANQAPPLTELPVTTPSIPSSSTGQNKSNQQQQQNQKPANQNQSGKKGAKGKPQQQQQKQVPNNNKQSGNGATTITTSVDSSQNSNQQQSGVPTNHQKPIIPTAPQLPPAPHELLKQRFHSPRDLDALVEKAWQKNLISPRSVERAGESLLDHWLLHQQQQAQFCNGARK